MMNIYESISAVMADIGSIGKDSKNQTQGFMYRGIDAVMNALNPSLVKNKVFVTPEVLEQTREERTNAKGTLLIYSIIKVRYTFYAEDGSSVSAVVIGEGMDTGDKATNKALSIAFKYACFQIFCIPTEEMVDPDRESHEVRKAETKKAEQKKQPTERDEAIEEARQKARVIGYVNRNKFTAEEIAQLCRFFHKNSLQELTLKDCNLYIDRVEKNGGHIDE